MQQVIFSRKTKKLLNPTLLVNNVLLKDFMFQTHLGLALNIKLNLSEHIKNITQKICKTMGLSRRLQSVLPRSSLLAIYKTFIISQLDYADVIHDQAYNSPFYEKLESLQYNTCLTITAVISGTASGKMYHKLGLESLKLRHCFRKLCHFYKIFTKKFLSYLFDLIPNLNRVHNTRHSNNTPAINENHDCFKKLILFFNYVWVQQAEFEF